MEDVLVAAIKQSHPVEHGAQHCGDALDEEEEEGQQRPKTSQHHPVINRRQWPP